jgi:hypothetical protein
MTKSAAPKKKEERAPASLPGTRASTLSWVNPDGLRVVTLETDSGRGRWYPLFAWIYAGLWFGGLIYTSVRHGSMALWVKIVVGVVLVLTTPDVHDLLLIRRYWRRNDPQG